ncbi:MAG: peptide deformylase [Candidatus Eisenbacteria bacterium]|nr:peptide deformylase [Candidatus Eisenbacteria bacterium]
MQIRLYPDPVLRQKCQEIGREGFGEKLRQLASCMLEIMYATAGLGLAAPQVGLSVRIIVADHTRDRSSPLVLVNPRIVGAQGEDVADEGCLSIPGIRARVRRYQKVTAEYETLERRNDCVDAAGLLARILQHETDHLDGVLFIDRLGATDKLAVRGALRRLASTVKQLKDDRG